MKIQDSYSSIFKDKNNILVIMAHPDDNEIICGGIVARLIKDGKNVRLIVTTNGGKGFQNRTDTNEIEFAKVRFQEQLAAGLELGIPESQNFNLDIPDGEMENNLTNIEKIARHIREFKPDIVITHNPDDTINYFSEEIKWVNHRDHRQTAMTALDASYPYSRDRGYFPHHFSDHNLEPHSVSAFLFSDHYMNPKVSYFDVTDFRKQKESALLKHKNALGEEIEGFMEEGVMDDGRTYERLFFVDTD